MTTMMRRSGDGDRWAEYNDVATVLADRLEELGGGRFAAALRDRILKHANIRLNSNLNYGYCDIILDVDGIVAMWASDASSSRIDPTALELMRMMTSACDRLNARENDIIKPCSVYLEGRLNGDYSLRIPIPVDFVVGRAR